MRPIPVVNLGPDWSAQLEHAMSTDLAIRTTDPTTRLNELAMRLTENLTWIRMTAMLRAHHHDADRTDLAARLMGSATWVERAAKLAALEVLADELPPAYRDALALARFDRALVESLILLTLSE